MRTSTKLFFSAVVILFAQSCKKEEPVSTDTPGVFYFDGNIGSSPVYLEAGQNDYYMFSSYAQDANGVYSFRGELAPYSCNTCGNRLKITINDFTPTATNGFAQIGTSLAPGFFSYAVPYGGPTEFNVQFYAGSTGGNPNSVDWDFGDGSMYSSPNSSVTHTYVRPGKYLVHMNANFSSDTSSLAYYVNVAIPDKLCTCSFYGNSSGNDVAFTPSVSGTSPFVYSWDFGDGNTSALSNPTHQYADPGVYAVKLWVEDAAGHQTEFMRHVATQYYTDPYTDFYTSPTVTTNPNTAYLSNVIIEWTDANGVSYTSNNAHQTVESYFKVIENSSYDPNSNGQSTRKLKLQFKSELYSASDSLAMNGYAVFAVAYH